MLFFCQTSRHVWVATGLPINIDGLPLEIKECIIILFTGLGEDTGHHFVADLQLLGLYGADAGPLARRHGVVVDVHVDDLVCHT